MKGVFQHCGEQHLHRYLAEFEFRYITALCLASMTLTVRAWRCMGLWASG